MEIYTWNTVKNILQEILDLDFDVRQSRLKTLPTQLREEVESLLFFEDTAKNWNPVAVIELSEDITQDERKARNLLIGQRLGIYEILCELGGGGMGTVYSANRADGKFEQKVALKILRREINNEEIRRYFKRESEIQAKLEHPFIARLLDVGTTDDGVPFFAMEYVKGIPIDKFCKQNNLSLAERLKLFNKVCQAVAHAHRNLIIHRDLKPSNILVNRDGEPKLLDFGISKLLDSEESEDKLSMTAFGAMTPEYASPEQIKGETVSTATDIYSLGVCLFKILTDSLPFDLKSKKNGELLRTIIEDEPLRPSEIENSRVEIRDSSSGHPKSEIRNLELKGDIDNIILKSLCKEPERRYKTVEHFSADIWRHLDGLPVAARPATFSYRMSKYLRRNRISVIAAALILISLIGGIAVSMQQAKTARSAQTQSERQFVLAKREEEKSKKISNFMFRVFSYANPAWNAEGRKSGGQARVLDALDDLSGKIETEFAGETDIQAELHHQFSEVYGRVWNYNTEPARREEMSKKSAFHMCRALELRREFYGDWHELVAKDLYYGADCIAKTDEERAAAWHKAIDIFRGTNPRNLNLPHILVDYAHRLVTPKQAEIHDIYHQAVNPTASENKYETAERYYREALSLFRNHYESDNLAIFLTECDLSYVLAIQNKWTDFDEHFSICKQGEPEMKKHYSTFEESSLIPLELVRETLLEKGVVR